MRIELSKAQMEGIVIAAEVCSGEGLGDPEFFKLALEVYKFLHPQGEDPYWIWAVPPYEKGSWKAEGGPS